MHPIDFLLSLVGKVVTVPVDQYDSAKSKLVDSYENWQPDGFFAKIKNALEHPAFIILAPILLPLLGKLISSLFSRWIGDRDGDGDIDPADAMISIALRMKQGEAVTASEVAQLLTSIPDASPLSGIINSR